MLQIIKYVLAMQAHHIVTHIKTFLIIEICYIWRCFDPLNKFQPFGSLKESNSYSANSH
jgi:hypothetical protein